MNNGLTNIYDNIFYRSSFTSRRFQSLCQKLFMAHSDAFYIIEDSIGDDGCDGYDPETCSFYAIYFPERPCLDAMYQKIQNKMNKDLKKTKDSSLEIKRWIFVTPFDPDKKIGSYRNKKQEEYSGFMIVLYGQTKLEELLSKYKHIKDDFFQFLYNASNVTLQGVDKTLINAGFHKQVDYSRTLLNDRKPEEALDYLNNLKSAIWNTCESIIKYRLLTNISAAKQMMEQYTEGASLSIEALQYNPDNEDAIINAAIGFFILSQENKGNELIQKALVKNPASERAFSVLINSLDINQPFEVFEKIAIEPERTQIAYSLGVIAQRKHLFDKSIEWLRIAVKNDERKDPDILACLAASLMMSGLPEGRFSYTEEYDEYRISVLGEALIHFRDAWDRVCNTTIGKYRTLWLYNISIIKTLLGDNEGAIDDAAETLRIHPGNLDYIRHNAILLHGTDRNKDALKVLCSVSDIKTLPDMIILKAEILKNERRQQEAISFIEQYLELIEEPEFRQKAQCKLIDLYLDIKDTTSAQKLSDMMMQGNPENILNLVNAAHISHYKGNAKEAKSILESAYKLWNDGSSERESLSLANGLLAVEQFDTAALIFEKIVGTSFRSPYCKKLLDCYYRGGDIKKTYELCRQLRETQGMIDFVGRTETAILLETDNLHEAFIKCEEYLHNNPSDEIISLQHACINLRLKNYDKVDAYLSREKDIAQLSEHNQAVLATLFSERGNDKKALDIMYDLRRKHPRDEDIHVQYIFFMLGRNREGEEILSVNEVKQDTVVFVKDDSGAANYFIIDNRLDSDCNLKEYNADDSAVSFMVGHKVGETVVVYENEYSKETFTITNIKSKYLHAFHESMGNIGKVIPKTPYFKRVHIPNADDQDAFRKSAQPLLDSIAKQQEAEKIAEGFYRDGRVTVGGLASLKERNILEAWTHLIHSADLCLMTCDGNVYERNNALNLMNKEDSRVALDILSLVTIHELEVADRVRTVFSTIGISRSTIDLIESLIKKRKTYLKDGYLTVCKKDDVFLSYETTQEDIHRSVVYYEGILKWIDDCCEVFPVTASLEIKREEKANLNKILGEESIDTVLIAKDNDLILFSDDKILRSLAKNEYGVNGIWTQALLMYCRNKAIFSIDVYNKCVITLARMNYIHTSIDASILIEAAKQANWMPSSPFTDTVRILGGKYSDPVSGADVSIKFTSEINEQDVSVLMRNVLIDFVFSAYTADRSISVSLKNLNDQIKRQYAISPIQMDNVTNMLKEWRIAHLL